MRSSDLRRWSNAARKPKEGARTVTPTRDASPRQRHPAATGYAYRYSDDLPMTTDGRPARGENWCKNGAFWCKNGRSHPRARHSAGRGLGELLGLPALSCENAPFSRENRPVLT